MPTGVGGGGAAALSQVWLECFGVVGVKKAKFVYKYDKALPLWSVTNYYGSTLLPL